MSFWDKIASAATLPLGGPLGTLVGGVAAQLGLERPAAAASASLATVSEVAFTIGFIALCAKIAKVDGIVTRDEVSAFSDVFKVDEREAENVARFFNLAKRDAAGYESYADQVAELLKDEPKLLQHVLECLFHIAAADKVFHPLEASYLHEVARRFGFSDTEYKHIRSRFVPASERSPYDVLRVEPSATNAELKAQYRRLVAESHPDKLMARGVPQEFVVIANHKLAAINAAYEEIRRERGF